MKKIECVLFLFLLQYSILYGQQHYDASYWGFLPEASGVENRDALQKAIDNGGTVYINVPGTYKLAGTVYVGSNTSIVFGNDIYLKKVNEVGDFSHVILNKGALTKTYDTNIEIKGLHIIMNGVDLRMNEVYGLRGQIAFFYVKDLRVERFRCLDLGKLQFGIHICTFEDIIIDDVIIEGDKDGIHLGRGNRFTIRNGVFRTYDDAIALNAHDYATSNPEMGWIENGVIENCYDLNDIRKTVGYFCRILGGGWKDWQKGMEVQHSDAVVSNGRIYRVQMDPDGTTYTSKTCPTHLLGSQILDGIRWGVVQEDVTYTAGVRNIVFRDIFLEKPRVGFSIHFDNDKYSRSYYPGAEVPKQEQLLFENVRVLHEENHDFISVNTPVDVVAIINSSFQAGGINFHGNKALSNYLKTKINMVGCTFNQEGEMVLVKNSVKGKLIELNTTASIENHDSFSAKIISSDGQITVKSDLTGLNN